MNQADGSKRESGSKQEREALREIVMPRVAAVEDRERLGNVEVEEAERWESPLMVVEAIDEDREQEDK